MRRSSVDAAKDVVLGPRTLRSGGLEREYLLARPRQPLPAAVPLVVDLHGSGFDPADQFRVGRSHRFAAEGAIIVAPRGHLPFRLFDGWPLGWAWNVPGSPLPGETKPRPGPDDLRFICDLLDSLLSTPDLGIDPRRVHVLGYSGGARLASHLPALLPWLASLACVAGLRFPVPLTGNTVAVVGIHGTEDPINPYAGGVTTRWSESVEDSAARWAEASGHSPHATSTDLGHDIAERRFESLGSSVPVRLLTVPGVGHAWPGAQDPRHVARFGSSGRFDATAYLRELWLEHLT